MAWHRELDASGRAKPHEVNSRHLVLQLIVLLAFALPAQATDESDRLHYVKSLYEQKKWDEVVCESRGPREQSSEIDYYAGMALAHLERWKEARVAFSEALRKTPGDPRSLTERAGAEYELNDFFAAKRDLRKSLRLNPSDSYVLEFLGTIYLLEGNLEAALKYWNLIDKPRLAAVEISPPPKTRKLLLDHAVLFSAPAVLNSDSLLKSDALLKNLGTFPGWHTQLAPVSSGPSEDEYEATLHLTERNGWGSSFLEGAISLFRGLPYQTVYPSY
jgi:tetratricopeptide (TPR) repeat protein